MNQFALLITPKFIKYVVFPQFALLSININAQVFVRENYTLVINDEELLCVCAAKDINCAKDTLEGALLAYYTNAIHMDPAQAISAVKSDMNLPCTQVNGLINYISI